MLHPWFVSWHKPVGSLLCPVNKLFLTRDINRGFMFKADTSLQLVMLISAWSIILEIHSFFYHDGGHLLVGDRTWLVGLMCWGKFIHCTKLGERCSNAYIVNKTHPLGSLNFGLASGMNFSTDIPLLVINSDWSLTICNFISSDM